MYMCNSFDEEHKVVMGHDYGGAVWFQVVDVTLSDRITNQQVNEIGKEVSVSIGFFDRILKPLLTEVFDMELPANKNRYTYAFSSEGRYVSGFGENILEPNFFTYDQMESVIRQIEDLIKDDSRCVERRFSDTDSIQLMTFSTYVRDIMQEHPETNLISVMS